MAVPHASPRARIRSWLRWESVNPRYPRAVKLAKQYLRWSRTEKFDVRLRYNAGRRLLSKHLGTPSGSERILDVGCGPLGLAHFMPGEFVGVDVQFPELPGISPHRPSQRVKGSIIHLPFRDGSFGIVSSMDTLEHLPRDARPDAVREMFRVASRIVLLGVPYGRTAEDHDRWALERERRAGTVPDWRLEHVANGLPGQELDSVVAECAAAKRAVLVESKGHENIRLLRLRWKVGMSITPGNLAYGLVMSTLNVVSRMTNVGRCYRRIYCVVLAS